MPVSRRSSFHTQSRLARSESEASRLARAALLLYVSSAEALVHQAAEELGRPELKSLLADPVTSVTALSKRGGYCRQLLVSSARRLDRLIRKPPRGRSSPSCSLLRASWAYPGPAPRRRAFYRSSRRATATTSRWSRIRSRQAWSAHRIQAAWHGRAPGCLAIRMPCAPATSTPHAASLTLRSRP